MLLAQHLLCSSKMENLYLVRLGPSPYLEQEACHPIDHSESTCCKLVQRFIQERKHTKASHHMRHQPELMAGVELILGGGVRHKLEGETAQLPLPVRLQSILPPRMYELMYCIAPLIRFPLNQRIILKRPKRQLQVVRCPFLSAEEKLRPRLIRRCRGL